MKIYLAMMECDRDRATLLKERLTLLGFEVVSVWHNRAPHLSLAQLRGYHLADDEALSRAAALLCVEPDEASDYELDAAPFVRLGQGLEFHLPTVWVGDAHDDTCRPEVREADTVDEGIEILKAWKVRLANIPDIQDYHRKALWTFVQHEDRRLHPELLL